MVVSTIKNNESETPKAVTRTERIKKYKNGVDSINKLRQWKFLKDHLYTDKNNALGFKTVEVNEDGIYIDRYITHIDEKQTLKSVIDIANFSYIGSTFYKDKNHIYTHYLNSSGGLFWIIEEADVATFKIIGACYGKDKNHIYRESSGRILKHIDYKTFITTEEDEGCFSKDKNGYYFCDEKLDSIALRDTIVKIAIEKLNRL